MSEHDYWQVESSVYGGVGYAAGTGRATTLCQPLLKNMPP